MLGRLLCRLGYHSPNLKVTVRQRVGVSKVSSMLRKFHPCRRCGRMIRVGIRR